MNFRKKANMKHFCSRILIPVSVEWDVLKTFLSPSKHFKYYICKYILLDLAVHAAIHSGGYGKDPVVHASPSNPHHDTGFGSFKLWMKQNQQQKLMEDKALFQTALDSRVVGGWDHRISLGGFVCLFGVGTAKTITGQQSNRKKTNHNN